MENILRPWVSCVFCKTTIIRQLRIWNELKIENTKRIQKKTVGILFMHGCK